VTDPARSAVLVDVRFQSLTGRPYSVYVLHDVGLGLNANDDLGWSAGGGLVASDGVLSGAVLASSGFTKTSSGYLSRSDGWSDLQDNQRMDWSYTARERGNVVQMGRTRLTGLPGAQRLTLSLGFATTPGAATSTAAAALGRGFASARAAYSAGWHRYLTSLRPLPHSAARWSATYDVSAMVLAASEDKTFRGGFVAAPGRPWAWANSLQFLPVYIAVWSRDLYQIATALLAAGDTAAANRALDYLWTVQQRPDGSFPQNSRLDGEPVFGGLQLDEVAFPIVLAWQLHRTGRRAQHPPGALGEHRWILAGHHRRRDRRACVRRRHRQAQRAGGHRGALPGHRRRLAAQPRALDGDHQRPAVPQALLLAHHRRRRRELGDTAPDLRRWPAGRPAAGR
jgi:glucoamylase